MELSGNPPGTTKGENMTRPPTNPDGLAWHVYYENPDRLCVTCSRPVGKADQAFRRGWLWHKLCWANREPYRYSYGKRGHA